MNNDEARAVLIQGRDALNVAINELGRYVREGDSWKATVKTANMAQVRAKADAGSVNLAAWTGEAALK